MDSYLIDRERWERDKPGLLERADLTDFSDSDAILNILDTALFQQYQDTNSAACNNPHLIIQTDGSFHIKTQALEASETDPL